MMRSKMTGSLTRYAPQSTSGRGTKNIVSGAEAVKAFETLDYEVVRQSGSHVRMKCAGRQPITVPLHDELKQGLLRSLIKLLLPL